MGTDICLCSEANNLGVERYVTKKMISHYSYLNLQ